MGNLINFPPPPPRNGKLELLLNSALETYIYCVKSVNSLQETQQFQKLINTNEFNIYQSSLRELKCLLEDRDDILLTEEEEVPSVALRITVKTMQLLGAKEEINTVYKKLRQA